MEKPNRYNLLDTTPGQKMEASEHGLWVALWDHVAAMQANEAELARGREAVALVGGLDRAIKTRRGLASCVVNQQSAKSRWDAENAEREEEK